MKKDEDYLRHAMQLGDNKDEELESVNSDDHKFYLKLLFVVCILSAIFWVFQSTIDINIIVRGEVVSDGDIEKIQHLEGGILDQFFVKEGDKVFQGQKIAQLTSVDRDSQYKVIEAEIYALSLEAEKLSALRDERDILIPTGNSDVASEELKSDVMYSWSVEDNKNKNDDALFLSEIQNSQQLILSMERRIISGKEQQHLIAKQLDIKNTLYKEEIASYVEVLNIEIQLLNMKRELQALEESKLLESQKLLVLYRQLEQAQASRKLQYSVELNEVKRELAIKHKHLPTAKDRFERLVLYSPIDGVVDNIHYNYQSAVIPPGESIADITSLSEALIAEVKIPRKDIGFLQVGQLAKVKVDAYNFSKYGFIEGKVKSISRSSYADNNDEQEYFIAKIELAENYLSRGGYRYYIAPNMELTCDITTGRRKVIEYALKPIFIAIEDAFDER